MSTSIKKLTQFFKSHKYMQLVIIVVAIVFMICFVPRLFIQKPVITDIISESGKDGHITDKVVTIHGENLQNTVAIYVNGQWIPQCLIVSNDDSNVDVRMPEFYYGSDEITCDVQVQTKINGEYFALSNKRTIYLKNK